MSTPSQTVEVTSRGQTPGMLRVFSQTGPDRGRAMEAARSIREIEMKHQPTKKQGGTTELRKIRDHGSG